MAASVWWPKLTLKTSVRAACQIAMPTGVEAGGSAGLRPGLEGRARPPAWNGFAAGEVPPPRRGSQARGCSLPRRCPLMHRLRPQELGRRHYGREHHLRQRQVSFLRQRERRTVGDGGGQIVVNWK
jgi:hypothetical protein